MLDIDTQGNLVAVSESTNYDASWESYIAPNHPPTYDPQWPGEMPAGGSDVVAINVKFDAYPGEVTWQLQSHGLEGWQTIESFRGEDDGIHNDLVTVQVEGVVPG